MPLLLTNTAPQDEMCRYCLRKRRLTLKCAVIARGHPARGSCPRSFSIFIPSMHGLHEKYVLDSRKVYPYDLEQATRAETAVWSGTLKKTEERL